LPGNSGSGDGAVADQAPGRSKATVRRALLAVLVAVIVVVGVVVVLGGGDDDANDTAGGPTTAAPPAVVHFTVADELLPNDLTEVVDLSIDLGPPMRFNGSPGAAERADVTVPEAGPHAYRLVVTTTTKEGEVFTFTGAGDFEAQEGRHFEVLLVPDTPKTVCLALDGICQTATA
jgi:hypothetical protein